MAREMAEKTEKAIKEQQDKMMDSYIKAVTEAAEAGLYSASIKIKTKIGARHTASKFLQMGFSIRITHAESQHTLHLSWESDTLTEARTASRITLGVAGERLDDLLGEVSERIIKRAQDGYNHEYVPVKGRYESELIAEHLRYRGFEAKVVGVDSPMVKVNW